MDYSQRQLELNAQFKLGVNTQISDSKIDIRFFTFQSLPLLADVDGGIINLADIPMDENASFEYPVFVPKGMQKADNAILLIHGLNERFWNKYLCWAEYLCQQTAKPIILFPMAFHMNRSPQSWTNPRFMKAVLDSRRKLFGEDRSLSFANVAFSERITEKPIRFYNSGRQSLSDLSQLVLGIKQGLHSLFRENTHIDIFAYSIGAFLSQITMMVNPKGLFSDSKLFMLCGGGIFSSMFGESRSIMDKQAFKSLFNYYLTDFAIEAKLKSVLDKVFESFCSMISPEINTQEREAFFIKLGNRLGGISLLRDTVIPYGGVVKALGNDCASAHIQLEDFDYSYTHENPFPIRATVNALEVDSAFNTVFSEAVQMLG